MKIYEAHAVPGEGTVVREVEGKVHRARVARVHFVSIGASLEAMAQRWCLVLDYMTGLVETIQDIESHLPRR